MLSKDSSLDSWLAHISSVHPREIDLGLDRISKVAARLLPARPGKFVVTVAGTNGKGSNVAAMEAMLIANKFSTGAFTSPHISRFNERIRLNGQDVSDEVLISGLLAIESCRQGESLSYFEYSTLLALLIFAEVEVDVAILEVGLGGRLDAVNLIDPDVAVITSISIDHEDWLGSDLGGIAAEKAGIMRENVPTVCCDEFPSKSINEKAEAISSRLYVMNQHYSMQAIERDQAWMWSGLNVSNVPIECGPIANKSIHFSNLASAMQALALLPLDIDWQLAAKALAQLHLAGRFELRRDRKSGCPVIFDVAHNPAAATLLAANLEGLQAGHEAYGTIAVVLAVMADKDVEEMVSSLESCSDFWYIAQVDEARSMPVSELNERLKNRAFFQQEKTQLECFESVSEAYEKACELNPERGLVVVSGSFFTVASVRDKSDAL